MAEPKLPKAVIEAGQKADKKIEELRQQQKPDENLSKKPEPQPQDSTNADQVQAINTSGNENLQPINNEQQNDASDQKYKVLKGKYDAEVPRLNAQVKELTESFNSIKTELERTKKDKAEAERITLAKEQSGERTVEIQKIKEEYGPELANLVEKLSDAHDALTTKNNELQSQLDTVGNTVKSFEEDSFSNSNDTFWKEVKSKVSDWEEWNSHPNMLKFLNEIDEISGLTKGQLFKLAQDELRAGAVIKLFQDFKESQQKGNAHKENLINSQIEPNNTNNGVGESITTLNEWTTSSVKQFYDDARRGKYKDNPQEYTRIDKEIVAAQAAGKIVNR